VASRPIRCRTVVVLPATHDWLRGHEARRFPGLQRGVDLRQDHPPMPPWHILVDPCRTVPRRRLVGEQPVHAAARRRRCSPDRHLPVIPNVVGDLRPRRLRIQPPLVPHPLPRGRERSGVGVSSHRGLAPRGCRRHPQHCRRPRRQARVAHRIRRSHGRTRRTVGPVGPDRGAPDPPTVAEQWPDRT